MNARSEPLQHVNMPISPEGPQPLLRPAPSANAYPVEALGPLRAAVEAVQDMTQAPVAIGAQSALSIAALAVQGFADVETLGDVAPCSLFCLTVAESGERKSTCDRLLIQGLRDYERAADEDYRRAYAEWETAREVWEGRRKRLIGDATAREVLKATNAEVGLRDLGPEPRPPLFPNVTTMEPTFEGLMRLYGIGRPALGLFTDEAGGFIGGHAMSTDHRLKTMAGLSRLWNGEPLDRTRAGDGVTTYRGRRLSAHLMAQPVAAQLLLADPLALGHGFLARFLICDPPSAIGTRVRRGHDPKSEDGLAAFTARLMTILRTPMPTTENQQELAPTRLPLSAAAKDLLWTFHETVERDQAPGGRLESVRAFASKSAEQAARIAGVLTLWADLNAQEISAEWMGSGINLADYYLAEAVRLVEAAAVSAEARIAETLRIWLVESWPHDDVLPAEILRHGPNRLRERDKLTKPLATLASSGWLVRLPEGAVVRGSTRREAYRIVKHAV